MLWLTPDLPDALVRVPALPTGVLHQPGQAFPHRRSDLGCPSLRVLVDPVQEHAPDIVLVLVPGPVADTHRAGPVVPTQVVDGPLGEVPLAPDAVHDLELERLVELPLAHRLEHKGEILEGFPVEPEAIERTQHEPGVSDPGVAVIPVAAPPGVSGSDVVEAAMMAPVGA